MANFKRARTISKLRKGVSASERLRKYKNKTSPKSGRRKVRFGRRTTKSVRG